MPARRPYILLWIPLICLLLAGAQCSLSNDDSGNDNSGDATTTARVDSEQKISNTAGGFSGNLDAGDQFGSAVASLGDLEGDGVTDLAVGAPYTDGNGTDRGAVWILFLNSDGRVDTQQRITDGSGNFDGNLADGDRFGAAVASLGDLDGDGVTDLAVGAPGDDDGGTDRGAVWILYLDAEGNVRLIQKISDTAGGFDGNLNDGDQFGGAVASIGDRDGDGIDDLAVGAPNAGDGGPGRGAVWILFLDTDGTVKSQQKIADGTGGFDGSLNDDDHFGSAVAGLGDLDGMAATIWPWGRIRVMTAAPTGARSGSCSWTRKARSIRSRRLPTTRVDSRATSMTATNSAARWPIPAISTATASTIWPWERIRAMTAVRIAVPCGSCSWIRTARSIRSRKLPTGPVDSKATWLTAMSSAARSRASATSTARNCPISPSERLWTMTAEPIRVRSGYSSSKSPTEIRYPAIFLRYSCVPAAAAGIYRPRPQWRLIKRHSR
jgi:hypothetical protein